MSRLAWLTPDDLPSEGLRRWLCIPNTPALLAAVHGALLPLTYEENWELYGTQTPEDTALAMSLMLEGFLAQEGQCLPMLFPPVIFSDQKTQNTGGGTATLGSWQTRTLNTMDDRPGYGAALASNEFTLPKGIWVIEWRAPAFGIQRHQSRLFSVTENAPIAQGSSEYSNPTSSQNTASEGVVTQNNNAPTTYRLEHRVQATLASEGYGRAANFGGEVYSQVKCYRME